MRCLLQLVGPDIGWGVSEAAALAGASVVQVLSVGSRMPSLAVAICGDPAPLARAAYTSAVLEHLGTGGPATLPFEPGRVVTGTYAVRVHGTAADDLRRALISLVWRCLPGGSRVDLDHPDTDLHAFVLPPASAPPGPRRVVWGRLLFDLPASRFSARAPRRRPFWTSLATEPRLGRFMVNLSRAGPGDSLLDPCCGTGSILIEAALLGLQACGSDVSERYVGGAGLNLSALGLRGELRQMDATDLQGWGRRFDAVASDLPYGRTASIHGVPRQRLYSEILASLARVLPPGGLAVLMSAAGTLPETAAFETLEVFDRVAHDQLTRRISVLRRRRLSPQAG